MVSSLAAALLREARQQAGMSQTELARRAGVAQSVISAYESGRREPALSTLARLVGAAGSQLHVTLDETTDDRVRGIPDTRLGRRVRRRRASLLAAAARHGGSNLRVFGSVARGEDGPDSDVDVLVDLAPDASLVGLSSLERELAQILGVDVDLFPVESLKPRIRARAEREAIPV